jgi:ribosomal protein S18 acetylase RimI-like enzyme
MPAFSVRPLLASDLEAARWTIYRAYLEALLDLYGQEAADQYEVRSPGFMRMYLHRQPAGCFAAVDAVDTLIGVQFCFVWGQVGWFGSLAVAPEWQGAGVGQALTARAVEHLEAGGCRRIGLETWPQSALVRHLYGKFGFAATKPTVKLSGTPALPASRRNLRVEWLSQDSEAALGAVAAVSRRVSAAEADAPPVDYRTEAAVAMAAGWADLLIVRDSGEEPAAFALGYVKKPSGMPVAALDLRLLLVAPGPGELSALDATLAAAAQRAAAVGASSVSCDVNLSHGRAVDLLRQRGLQPVYELLRMERPVAGFDATKPRETIECARWAG